MISESYEFQNMLPWIILLMRDDSSTSDSTSSTSQSDPKLDPDLEKRISNINELTALISEMGLNDLAPIPDEWNIPNDGVSNEIIQFLEENPGNI